MGNTNNNNSNATNNVNTNINVSSNNNNIQNVKNETAHHNDAMNPNKGSPRIGRLRGISPQSREKAYATGSNNNQ